MQYVPVIDFGSRIVARSEGTESCRNVARAIRDKAADPGGVGKSSIVQQEWDIIPDKILHYQGSSARIMAMVNVPDTEFLMG